MLYFGDNGDRENFFDILSDTVKRCNWLCHAYCLMDTHYHILIETPEANLSLGMRQLNGVYTQRYNKKHKQVFVTNRQDAQKDTGNLSAV